MSLLNFMVWVVKDVQKNLRVIKSRTKRRIFRKKMSKYVETGPIYVHYVNMRALSLVEMPQL